MHNVWWDICQSRFTFICQLSLYYLNTLDIHVQNFRFVCWNLDCIGILSICLCSITMVIIKSWGHIHKCRHESFYIQERRITRNYRWFAHLHIQNGVSKRIWILAYSWTGNFLLAWAGQFSGIKNHTMHRFDQYLKILQLYHENSRFPPSFKFWSVSAIQKHWEEMKKCILHGFQDLKALFL